MIRFSLCRKISLRAWVGVDGRNGINWLLAYAWLGLAA
jgi:hypothetical protein